MVAEFKSIFDLLKAFPTEQSCIEHLEKLMWDGNPVSPFDPTSKVYKCAGIKYKCKSTGKYFNVRTGTIFDNTKIPLQKWFMALYVFSSHKKGISSHQLAKDISVTQKSAWFMLHRLRYAFDHPNFKAALSQMVEVDETYVGGKMKNKHLKERTQKHLDNSSHVDNKTGVIGYLERGSNLKMEVLDKEKTFKEHVRENVNPEAIIITDAATAYKGLDKEFEGHEVVNHIQDEFVRGDFHTNSIEGAFGLFKRMVIGIYHQISPKHLQSYVDEFVLRFNTRKFKTQNRFDFVLSAISGKRLTYKELIG
jgi:transposase-like protein